ncbi:MAG: response regulator transcription factor [Bacteroidota bacterium]
MIKVAFIEDNELLLNEYEATLQVSKEIECVLAVDGIESFIQTYDSEAIDLIFLDLMLVGMDGLNGIPKLQKLVPQASIIILSLYITNKLIAKALKAGASGYLAKGMEGEELINGIKKMYDNKDLFSPDMRDKMLKFFNPL